MQQKNIFYREYFDRQKWKYSWLTGRQNNTERQKEIAGFQDNPDNLLFLISLKAGGVGLNLTAADYVFLLDPWWNPAVEKQAIRCAHRIGQGRKVFSYKFISGETVEEKILDLQRKKSELAEEFIKPTIPSNCLPTRKYSACLNDFSVWKGCQAPIMVLPG